VATATRRWLLRIGPRFGSLSWKAMDGQPSPACLFSRRSSHAGSLVDGGAVGEALDELGFEVEHFAAALTDLGVAEVQASHTEEEGVVA
jgi:hypothetical protein